jgi:hypothetical protein
MNNLVLRRRESLTARVEQPRKFGQCRVKGCERIALSGPVCYECAAESQYLSEWERKRNARRQAVQRGRSRWAFLEWFGPLVFVSCGMAYFLFAERGFILGCFDKLQNVWK